MRPKRSEEGRNRKINQKRIHFLLHWSGGDKKEAGVGFSVSNSLSNVHLDISNISDRLMTLMIQLKSGNHLKLVMFVSVYAPTL